MNRDRFAVVAVLVCSAGRRAVELHVFRRRGPSGFRPRTALPPHDRSGGWSAFRRAVTLGVLLTLAAGLVSGTLAGADPAPAPLGDQPFLTGLMDLLGRSLGPGNAMSPGDRLIALGQHFGTTVGRVAYNGTPLMIWSWTDAAIVVMLPPGLGKAPGGGDLLIQRSDGRYYQSGPHFSVGPESPVAAPTELTATAVLPTQVNLSWALLSNNELGVEIYRRAGAGRYILIADLAPGTSRFSDWYAARGTSYTYRVRVANDVYASDYTNEASVVTSTETPVNAPSGLSAAAVLPTQVNLSWILHSDNELGVEIYRKAGAGSYLLIADLPTGSSRFSDWYATRGTSYTYRVRAANDFYASDYSNEVGVTTSTETPVAAPSGLTAAAVLPTQVNLSWNLHSSNELGIEIYRKAGVGEYVLIADLGPESNSFSDWYAARGTSYTYRVRATNHFYASEYTNEASVVTSTETPVAAPSGLTAVVVLPTQVNLSWTLSSNNERGVEIYRRAGTGLFLLIADLAPGSSRFSDWYAARGTSYTYRVRVANSFYASDYTNEASVITSAETPVKAPTGLTATAVSSTQVNLSWTNHPSSEIAYEIYRKSAGGSYILINDVAPGASSFSDLYAAPGTTYTYRVRAVSLSLVSDYSNEMTVTTSR